MIIRHQTRNSTGSTTVVSQQGEEATDDLCLYQQNGPEIRIQRNAERNQKLPKIKSAPGLEKGEYINRYVRDVGNYRNPNNLASESWFLSINFPLQFTCSHWRLVSTSTGCSQLIIFTFRDILCQTLVLLAILI